MSSLAGQIQRRIFPHQNTEADQQYLENCPTYEDAINQHHQRRIPTTTPHLTPYLGLQARLSQVWFNRWTVLLFLVLVRVMLATTALENDLDGARDKALSACTGVESMGSAMVSMPHYMSKGVNEIAATGVEAAVKALAETLQLLITAINAIIIFAIHVFTQTYMCLIELTVKGTIGAVADVTKEITDGINNIMGDITKSLEGDVKSSQDILNGVMNGVDKASNMFGVDVNIPTIEIPSISKLKDIKIPDTLSKRLEGLEKDVPDFKDVQKAADDVISIPFNKLKELIDVKFKIFQFDRSIFPVPEKQKMTFCSDNPTINNFFNKLEALVRNVRNILVGILTTLAILVMAPMAYREIHNWRNSRSRAYMVTDTTREFDPVDVVYISSRPASSTFGLRLASRFKSKRHQVLIRWAVSYITSPAATFVLSLGIAGLAGALCQYILLKQVESKSPELAAEIGQFAGLIVDELNTASESWGNMTNVALQTVNDEINQEVFGWAKEGTNAINDTLTTLVDKMKEGVDGLFGGTPLEEPIKGVLNCVVFYKVDNIQKGLTWVHDHAKVTFPKLPADTFSLGALSSLGGDSPGSESFLSNPDSFASDQVTEVVVKLTNKWERGLSQEAAISGGVTAIWGIVLLIALGRILMLWFGKDKIRGEGGEAPNYHDPSPIALNQSQNPFADHHARSMPNFPVFTVSPNESYPKTPQAHEFRNEKGDAHIEMGTVRSGTSSFQKGPSRKSIHTKFEGRGYAV